jgi:MoxR-like ATPase
MTSIFSEEYLLERPLLRSIRSKKPVVLLIDELDKTDEEFEAFLLEILAEMQVTIPELGTIEAVTTPFTILTSNNTRPLSDALRRRCVYVFLEYPDLNKELAIINARFPGVPEKLARSVAAAVQVLRADPHIIKKPSIAETLDWLEALRSIGATRLDTGSIESTVGALLKSQRDIREALSNDSFTSADD